MANPRLILFLILCFLTSLSFSQKVGLVLSGGGAKGLAHVGVIRALEENHIPIDYIAGTSMGAIVGGLYAIGYSPDEMEQLLSSKDFQKWSTGEIDIQEQYYYKRKNTTPDWIDLDFLKSANGELKPQLPTNIVSPEQMDLRFMQFYEPAAAAANYSFNQLFVPFFCVASDVHRNKAFILSSGNLSSAIRASMTFPGYFKPISIDSVLLFDGGMENNFPTDIMENKFHPDILIGSKVASNPQKPDADDVYLQLENVFMKTTNYRMPKNGILIEPQVEKYGLLDIEDYDSIDARGYEAARAKMDSIKLLVNRKVSDEELAARRDSFRQNYKPLIFKNIYITGVDPQAVDYIIKNIRRNRDILTFNEFEQEYFKLLSDKLIRSVYPEAVYNKETGFYDLYLEIKTKNAFSLNIGGNLSSNLSSMVFAGIDYVFQKKNIYNASADITFGKFYSGLNGKFRMDFPPRTVSRNKILTPFYIDLSIAASDWEYVKLTSEWFVDSNTPSQVSQSDIYGAANFGRPVSTRGIFYTGYAYGLMTDDYFHTNLIEQKDIPDKTKLQYSTLHATYEYNSLNYKQYENNGRYIKVQVRYITGSEEYSPGTTAIPYNATPLTAGHSWINISFNYKNYIDINRYFTLGYNAYVHYSNKSSFSNSMSTLLSAPNFAPFPQSQVVLLEKFKAFTWAAGGLIPIIHLTNKIDARGEAYIYQPYQYILTRTFQPSFSNTIPSPHYMGSLALVYQTPIGPLAITGSYFMKEETNFYFQINFGYVLFNNRGVE